MINIMKPIIAENMNMWNALMLMTIAHGVKEMIELGILLIASGLLIMGGGCFICMAIITGALLYQHRKDKEHGKD